MCHRRARTHRGLVLLMPDEGRAFGCNSRPDGAETRTEPKPSAGSAACPSPRAGDVAIRCAAMMGAFERWVALVDRVQPDGDGGDPRREDETTEEAEGALLEWEAGVEWLERAPSLTPADADAKVAAAEALVAHSGWCELRYVALLARAASEALRLHRAAMTPGAEALGPVASSPGPIAASSSLG